jgi:hypothetical protein
VNDQNAAREQHGCANPQSTAQPNPQSNPQPNPKSNPQSNPQSAIRNPQFQGAT